MSGSLGRRDFLGGIGAAAAAGAAVSKLAGTKAAGELGDASPQGAAAGPNPLAAAGVVAGAAFHTCSVIGVAKTDDGSVGVSLAGSDGRLFRLEVLGHDSRTPGVAKAGSLSVYVNNRGRGDTRTDEEHGLAAMALAAHLARREAAGVSLPSLPTLTERSRA